MAKEATHKESPRLEFTFKELAELMVKAGNIHKGHWAIYVTFGLGAANIKGADTPIRPTALIPVTALGIQEVSTPTELSVDAAQVNPAPKRKGKKAK